MEVRRWEALGEVISMRTALPSGITTESSTAADEEEGDSVDGRGEDADDRFALPRALTGRPDTAAGADKDDGDDEEESDDEDVDSII